MKKFTLEIKWAVIFTVSSIIWVAFEKTLGFHNEHIEKQMLFGYLFAIPAILIYALALSEKKRTYFFGKMNWMQGVVSGVFMSLFISILSPLAQYISYEIVSPDFFKNAIDYATPSKVMSATVASDYFNLKSYIIQGALGGISSRVVTSAIVAYFLQSKSEKK